MSIIDLFSSASQKKRISLRDEDGDVMVIDVTTSERHEFQSKITEFPIEDGASISDHIIDMPFKLTMECLISDDPIKTTFSSFLGQTSLGVASSYIGSAATLVVSRLSGSLLTKNRSKISKTARDKLEEYRKGGARLIVSTSLDQYTDMLIESISIPRSSKTAAGLTFTLVMKKVIFAVKTTTTITLENLSEAGEQASSNISQGLQTATDITGTGLGDKASLLIKLGKAAGVTK